MNVLGWPFWLALALFIGTLWVVSGGFGAGSIELGG